MVKQSDSSKAILDETCGNHGNTDDEFMEYSEEEMLSEEELNENLNLLPKKRTAEGSDEETVEEIQCGDNSEDEDLCTDQSIEDSDEEPDPATENSPNEEILEEELSEESEGEEPERVLVDEPLVNNHHGHPSLLEKSATYLCTDSKISADIQCSRELNSFSTDVPLASNKKRHSRWDIKGETAIANLSRRKTRWSSDILAETTPHVNSITGQDKRRKTRWSTDEAQLSIPCELPDSVKDIISNSCNDEHIKRLSAMLLKINKKLEWCVAAKMHPQVEIFHSQSNIDDGLDSPVNLRFALLKQKFQIISELLASKKKKDEPKPKFSKMIYIPTKEHPHYNFLGLIIGPKGNTLKKMEKETGATILIRGKGSNLKKKNCPDEQDDLHVFIETDSQTSLTAAVSMVEKLLVPVDDLHNHHKAAQLRELAELRGTLQNENSWELKPCDVCGQSSHLTSECPLTATNTKLETISGSLFSSLKGPFIPTMPIEVKTRPDKLKGSDPSNLFVGFLPQTVSSDKLKELFLPYGKLYAAKVMEDKITGQSKGCGFVKYTSASDAAMAIEKMNGYLIDGKKLAVRIAGTTLNASLPNYPELAFALPPSLNAISPDYFPLSNEHQPNYSQFPAFSQKNSEHNFWPGPPGSMLLESSISSLEVGNNSLGYTGNMYSGIPPPSLNAVLPTYPGFANIQRVSKPTSWPGPSGSILPEQIPYYPKSGSNIESVPPRFLIGSTNQTSFSSSDDLSSFPGYLKSIDALQPSDQSMFSSNLSSRAPYRFPDFSSDRMSSSWPQP